MGRVFIKPMFFNRNNKDVSLPDAVLLSPIQFTPDYFLNSTGLF